MRNVISFGQYTAAGVNGNKTYSGVNLRENESMINFTLSALRVFFNDIEEEGFLFDDLPESAQTLVENLMSFIFIRVKEAERIEKSK